MIDSEGYRHNVGIIIANAENKLLIAKRIGFSDAWQFPQGGMKKHESSQQAMYRELEEELGLIAEDVEIIAETADWLIYDLPKRFIRHDSLPVCIGQKQKWFLLRLVSDVSRIHLSASHNPEFDEWRWVDYWVPAEKVISFKKHVYQQALEEFAKYLIIEM